MANGDKTILYVDKVATDNYRSLNGGDYYIFNVGIYKSIRFSGDERYDIVEGLKNTIISSSQDWYDQYRTGDYITDSTEIVQINSKDYYKLDAYIWTEGYTYSSGQKLFFAIGGDTMTSRVIAENNFEQTVVEFDYNLNEVTPDYFLWDVTDGVESLKVSYTEPPHKIISEIQYPDETIYDIKDKNALNKSQITNCILEVPQRIKYELADGTLTVKAGSVVIVPYGTEDLTTQYPKGSTFLNDNFKVYDTQFSDGKFFVWAELVNDISRTGFSGNGNVLIFVNINNSGSGTNALGQASISNVGSGTSDPNTSYYYRTDENKVYHLGNWYGYSLPVILGISNGTNLTSINQVFNGMGYIGSTVWVDKGVKGLIPDGRNEDGTLNNVEWLNDKLELRSFTFSGTNNTFGFSPLVSTKIQSGKIFYNETENYNYSSSDKWLLTSFATGDLTDGVISNFRPKLPFRAVDYGDIDGQWVTVDKVLFIKKSWAVGSNEVTYSLDDIIPNDGYNYEVLVSADGNTGATAGSQLSCYVKSSIALNYPITLYRNQTRTSSAVCSGGACIVPIGPDHTITFEMSVTNSATGNTYGYILAYRRIGKNQ